MKELLENEIVAILGKPKVQQTIKTYGAVMDILYKVDVSADENFIKKYRNLYSLQGKCNCIEYFKLLENRKNDKNIEFEDVFGEIYDFTGHENQISFSSKALHTIRPEKPIWDEKLIGLNNFNLNGGPRYPRKWSFEECVYAYENYCKVFEDFLVTDGQTIIDVFDKELPNYKKISDVKKIDFVLWER